MPGVEKQGAAGLEVLGVARDQSEIAAERGRRDQHINDRRVSDADNSPQRKAVAVSMGKIRSAKLVAMPSTQMASPLRRHQVGAPLQGDAFAQLS